MAVSIDSNATWCPCFVVELYGEWAATVTFAMDKTTEQIKGPPKGIDITNGKGFPGFDAQPALHAHTEDWEKKVRDINTQVARCQTEGADFTDVDNRWWATWATSEQADIDAEADKTHPVRTTPPRTGWAAVGANDPVTADIAAGNATAAEQLSGRRVEDAAAQESRLGFVTNPIQHSGYTDAQRKAAEKAQVNLGQRPCDAALVQ